MRPPLRVLFLCTGNSCRSQMAEAWAHVLHPGVLEASSAGTAPQGMDPRTVRVMAEAGVDLSGCHSKALAEFLEQPFDAVFTVCGAARESCPRFPGRAPVFHHGFPDPPAHAREILAAGGSEEDALVPYREVRDAIRVWVAALPEELETLLRK